MLACISTCCCFWLCATGAWTLAGTTYCVPPLCLNFRLIPRRQPLARMNPITPQVQNPVRHCYCTALLWCCHTWCWWCLRGRAGLGVLFHPRSVTRVPVWVACSTWLNPMTRWRGRPLPSWPGLLAALEWCWSCLGTTNQPHVVCSSSRSVCFGFSSWH